MATDPNLDEETKRRLREARQAVPDLLTASLAAGPGTVSRPGTPLRRAVPSSSGAGSVGDDTRGLAAARVRAQAAAGRTQQNFVTQAEANRTAQEDRLREQGVTRIRRGRGAAGENVYTNVPGDGLIQGPEEERFYGAFGQRIGQGLSRQATTPDQVAPGAGRAQAFQQADNDFYAELNRQNEPQLRSLGRSLKQAQEQTTPAAYEYALDEQGRTTLMPADQAAARNGLRRGSSGGADIGDQIRLLQLQETMKNNELMAGDRARTAQRLERADLIERYSPENRAATIQQELQILRGMNNQDREAFFNSADPAERERANLLLSNINTTLGDTYMANAGQFGSIGLDRPSSFGSLRKNDSAIGGGINPFETYYTAAGDDWQRGVTAGELAQAGISEEDLPWLMDFMARRDATRSRR